MQKRCLSYLNSSGYFNEVHEELRGKESFEDFIKQRMLLSTHDPELAWLVMQAKLGAHLFRRLYKKLDPTKYKDKLMFTSGQCQQI